MTRSGAAGTLCFLLALAVAAGAGAPEKPKEARPRVNLKVEPAVGFTPLALSLTGQLTGVDPKDANFCHPSVTWTRIDPGRNEDEGLRVREDPACLHDPEVLSIPRSFSKNYTLYTPGAYLFRLVIEGHDGTKVNSGLIKVQVLRVQ